MRVVHRGPTNIDAPLHRCAAAVYPPLILTVAHIEHGGTSKAMDRLWTPWRGAYVSGSGKDSGCFLCTKPGESQDEENLILYRGERVYVLMNLYPYNSGHVLVAPYEHTGNFPELETHAAAELMAVSQRCVAALAAAYHADGFNAGMNLGSAAGAGEPDHLHVHIVPRWIGDTNFMPVVGQTKVLPESLEQSYARLKPYFGGGR
jgi:ATP adenylyltransferase